MVPETAARRMPSPTKLGLLVLFCGGGEEGGVRCEGRLVAGAAARDEGDVARGRGFAEEDLVRLVEVKRGVCEFGGAEGGEDELRGVVYEVLCWGGSAAGSSLGLGTYLTWPFVRLRYY